MATHTKQWDIAQLKDFLDGKRAAEGLMNVEETASIEFKAFPYLINNPGTREKACLDLVSDVSAIANFGGGYLVFGAKTEKHTEKKVDCATEIVAVNKADIVLDAWLSILQDRLLPSFSEECWDTGFAGENDELFWIKIGPTPKELFPLIIAKDTFEGSDGKILPSRAFACLTRVGAQNAPLIPAVKVQEYLAVGLRATKNQPTYTDQLLLELLDQVKQVSGANTVKQGINKIADDFLAHADKKIQTEQGYFYLLALPDKPVNLEVDFWDKSHAAYKLVDEPPYYRKMGWDHRKWITEPTYPSNNSWEAMNGDSKLFSISKNGVIFAAGRIDGFLNHGVEGLKNDLAVETINCLALVEYIATFVNVLIAANGPLNLGENFTLRLGIRSAQQKAFTLARPPITGHSHNTLAGKAEETFIETRFKAEISRAVPPELLAGKIIMAVYRELFGIAEDFLPYLKKDESDNWVVDKVGL